MFESYTINMILFFFYRSFSYLDYYDWCGLFKVKYWWFWQQPTISEIHKVCFIFLAILKKSFNFLGHPLLTLTQGHPSSWVSWGFVILVGNLLCTWSILVYILSTKEWFGQMVSLSMISPLFLDAFSHLYKKVCPCISPSIHLSVGRSHWVEIMQKYRFWQKLP